MKTPLSIRLPLILAATLALPGMAGAKEQAIVETLNSTSSSLNWTAFNGACLTAGDGTGKIPACVGLAYYAGKTLVGGDTGTMPDVAGSGALRLSNGDNAAGTNGNNQTGSIVSNFTFGTADGIQITWTSVSYGGNNYNGTGADGTVFFLSDGTLPPTIGAFGGSLGYSCANGKNPSDGVTGGYLGVGIDEFGNFSNPGDNTESGPGFFPGRIAVRGAGFTSWDWLSNSAAFGKYYKGAANATAIQKTCASGYAYNYSGASIVDSKGNTIANGGKTGDSLPFNYPLLYSVPSGTTLANQQAVAKPTRQAAIPIVFSLKITSDGLLDFSYSAAGGATQAVVTGLKITDHNGPLPPSFRFGFSSGTGGGSNVHEITCFKAEPADAANTTAGANVQQGQVVLGVAQVFLAFYHPVNWWGSMTANALSYDASTDTLTASATSTWDGGCVITGGDCQTMTPQTTPATTAVQVSVQAPSSRAILSYNAGGVPFQTASLSASQLALLGSNAANQTIELNYLRGVRSNEQTNSTGTAGTLRNRTSVLADIIDSSPVWVGAPGFNYANAWQDKLYTSTTPPEGTSYATFQTTNANRMNMVYVGSNDGLLHGFRAGVLNTAGTALTSNDGQELLAYVPDQVISAIHPTATANVGYDYSNVLYQHNFQVDATPGMGDLYYSGAWHTWLVTGLGAGGHPNGPVNSNATVNGSGVATQLIPDPVGALFAPRHHHPGQLCRGQRQLAGDRRVEFHDAAGLHRQRDLQHQHGPGRRHAGDPPAARWQLGCHLGQRPEQQDRPCRHLHHARGVERHEDVPVPRRRPGPEQRHRPGHLCRPRRRPHRRLRLRRRRAGQPVALRPDQFRQHGVEHVGHQGLHRRQRPADLHRAGGHPVARGQRHRLSEAADLVRHGPEDADRVRQPGALCHRHADDLRRVGCQHGGLEPHDHRPEVRRADHPGAAHGPDGPRRPGRDQLARQ